MTRNDIPEIRQDLLVRRIAGGETLRIAALAGELGVSVDTLRRDLAALERAGQVRRVRGGAVPATPARPLRDRGTDSALPDALLRKAVARLEGARTLALDGGTSVLALARALGAARGPADRLVVTPSPLVAAATHAAGIETIVLGGPLSLRGGTATGAHVHTALADITADVAILGACGLDAGYGLTADDLPDAETKRALAACAARVWVASDAAKLGRRARHRVVAAEAIDLVVTDADAARIAPYLPLDLEIVAP